MIVASPQAYLVPPHERGRRNMITVAAKRQKPGRSREVRIAAAPVFISLRGRRSGIVTKNIAKMTIAPTGRLM